uniref:RNA-binding region-containing protein 3 n=1 Tax=Phallusia mammillata TaxID=59560 RepID=A0A6F9DRP0_9ASCI|nr:RNA-binding protein 40-like [Phallusia mammillata]
MSNYKKTLFVKHLPPSLSQNEKKQLFELFGPKDIRIMPDHGRFKNTAFITFENDNNAKEALTKLHQLEILDFTLSVEYARKCHDDLLKINTDDRINDSDKTETEPKPKEAINKINTDSKKCQFCRRLPPIAPGFGLKYPANPGLKYKYPEPNSNILLNICAALVTVPKFYTQVLHLMNKMNMYCPFSQATHIPPMLIEHIKQALNVNETLQPNSAGGNNDMEESDVEMVSNTESEYESSNEDTSKKFDPNLLPPEKVLRVLKRKRKAISSSPKRKLARLKDTDTLKAKQTHQTGDKDGILFDKSEVSAATKHIKLKLPSSIELSEDKTNDAISAEETGSGFGRIKPKHATENVNTEEDDSDYKISFDFISRKQLDSGRLSSKDMSSHSVFKNYRPGEPSCRLYVKNLSKKVTDKDMRHIFGAFVDFDNEEEAKMFDVRVMTQGRMKGQAFVGMPSVKTAKEALNSVNGYQLIGKPMVVLYARSAKPKSDSTL